MSDIAPGKGKRVVGTFILMMGAGIVLDTHAVWVGAPVLLIGVVALIWGLVEARVSEAVQPIASAPIHDSPVRPAPASNQPGCALAYESPLPPGEEPRLSRATTKRTVPSTKGRL